jgi:anti-anti-sigma factor
MATMPADSVGGVPVVTPTGALDLAGVRSLASKLAELAGSPGDTVLDLSQVGFMDSVGLAVVLKAANRFRRQDKQLVVVVPPAGNIARLIDVTGASAGVSVAGTRDEALSRAAPAP